MVEYDWGADAKELLAGRRRASNAPGYDVVICADCVYARASVEPLLESLRQARDLELESQFNLRRAAFDGYCYCSTPPWRAYLHFLRSLGCHTTIRYPRVRDSWQNNVRDDIVRLRPAVLLLPMSPSHHLYHTLNSFPPYTSICLQVCDENTILLVTNELRSAFDEFLRRARGYFEVEDLVVLEDDMVVDAASNQRPKPVALKRLRRRVQCSPLCDAPSR